MGSAKRAHEWRHTNGMEMNVSLQGRSELIPHDAAATMNGNSSMGDALPSLEASIRSTAPEALDELLSTLSISVNFVNETFVLYIISTSKRKTGGSPRSTASHNFHLHQSLRRDLQGRQTSSQIGHRTLHQCLDQEVRECNDRCSRVFCVSQMYFTTRSCFSMLKYSKRPCNPAHDRIWCN